MSLYLEFEPHSYYKGFAIKRNLRYRDGSHPNKLFWQAFTDNGNTYRIDEIKAFTLKELKQLITEYRSN
jgi:hypothetical protein